MINAFFIIVLAAVLIDYLLGLVADLLNLKALQNEPPLQLNDIYDNVKYRKSQEYLKAHTRFGILGSSFNLALLLLVWLTGTFNMVDQIVRGWNFTPVINGLIYIAIIFAAYSIIELPFQIFGTFVIEERFGFNKTTPRLFIIDRLKSLAIAVPLGALLLTGVLALFEYAGVYAWLYAWIGVTLVSLMISYVAPTWIMPLFNKFTPMPQGELRDAIIKYTNSVNFSLNNVFVMDGSKRSSKSNAFFTGFGSNKRIALFDTLIEQHTVPELVSVIAHETGHYKKKHILQGIIISLVNTILVFFLLSVFLNSRGLYEAFFMQQSSVYTGLLFFGLLYTPLELLLGLGMQALSRHNEYEADRFAVTTTGDPGSMISALKKLSSHNLSNLTPHPFYVLLNYSHPPLLQRIKAIEKSNKG